MSQPYRGEPQQKVALTHPNDADEIHRMLERDWPEIARLKSPDVWVTGSRVWKLIYGLKPEPEADLDIFVMAPVKDKHGVFGNLFSRISRSGDPCATHLAIEQYLRTIQVAPPPGTKIRTSLGGDRIHTKRGAVDLWTCHLSSPVDQLMNYPNVSHGQARVAYCPASGQLITLRNPMASPTEMLLKQRVYGIPEPLTFRAGANGGGGSGQITIVAKEIVNTGTIATVTDMATFTATKPEKKWNEKCSRCGKGIYRGLFLIDHEGGKCPNG